MDNTYTFFDRAFFDPIWDMSWHQFGREHPSRWLRVRKYERGEHDGTSLRGLLGFSMDPEPTDDEIEDSLARETIRRTIRRTSPQYWVMGEIMDKVPRGKAHHCVVDSGAGVFISAFVSGFLQGRISKAALRAGLKLHGCGDPGEWLMLTSKQKRALAAALEDLNVWTPIYRWQGPEACADDEWTNCLGLQDTHRFTAVVDRAWREDWALVPLEESLPEVAAPSGREPLCSDFPLDRQFRRALTMVRTYARPSVFREFR